MPRKDKTRKELIQDVMGTLMPGINTYKHFTYLGRFPIKPIIDDCNYEMPKNEYISCVSKELLEQFELMAGDYVISKSTRKHLDISVRKADVKPIYDFEKHEFWRRSFDYVCEMNREVLTVCSLTLDEVYNSIDLTKSAGFISGLSGFKTKDMWFKAGFFPQIFDSDVIYEMPIYKYIGKVEPRLREHYVDLDKQRTMSVQPPELLLHTKRIFGNQNENMKGHWWSSYGHNPYQGGVDKLAHSFRKFKRFFMLDGIGWDRKSSWMKAVYQMRVMFLQPDYFLEWCARNNMSHYCVLPNGDFIWKDWGNQSGGGNTTSDNIFGMEFVMTLVGAILCKGDLGKLDSSLHCCCFGDDVVAGDNFSCSDEELRSTLIHTFALFGIEIDPLVISKKLEDMTFLGYRFKKIFGGWIPQYDLSRLSRTFLSDQHKMTLDGQLTKLYSVMLMSAGNGVEKFNLFREAFLEVVCNSQANRYAKLFLQYGVPEYSEVISWYLGSESSKSSGLFFLPDPVSEFLGIKGE